MSWINALEWPQWLMLGLVPPLIVLLYFLKLRRSAVEVPSTYLWTRTIEDLHVNSIWQRLRNSLLLILQLLLVGLLLFSCLQPGCDGEELSGDRFIFLIDQSASMAARDAGETGDKARLEEAKAQVENMIDRMKSGDVAMILSFSDRSNVVQSYTRNKVLLKRQLATVAQTQRGTEMSEALVAAAGLANPGRTSDRESSVDVQVAEALAAKLFIFSDGGVASTPSVSLGENLQAEYRPIGAPEPSHNLGITAFSVSNPLQSDNQLQAFSRIQNSDDEDHTVGVTLYVDNEIFDAQANVEIAAESTVGLNFDLSGLANQITEPRRLRLQIDSPDVYEFDNTAFAVINPPRKAKVLVVTESNPYLKYALETDRSSKIANVEFQPPGYLEEQQFKKDAELGVYDLIIFDQCTPETVPLCHAVYFNELPPGDQWKFGEKQSPTPIVDTNQGHPLLYSISLTNITVIDSQMLEGPQGTVSLVDSANGSVMAIGPRGGFEDLVVGFPLVEYDDNGDGSVNTDWVSSLSFPLFIQNVLMSLGGGTMFDTIVAQQPGKIVSIKPQLPYPVISVRDPNARSSTLNARRDNTFAYANTENTGIYEVVEPESKTVEQMFAINLMDSRESDLTVREKLEIGFQEVEGVRSVTRPVRKEFWPWIIGAALLVLIVEWYIYNRRVFI